MQGASPAPGHLGASPGTCGHQQALRRQACGHLRASREPQNYENTLAWGVRGAAMSIPRKPHRYTKRAHHRWGLFLYHLTNFGNLLLLVSCFFAFRYTFNDVVI